MDAVAFTPVLKGNNNTVMESMKIIIGVIGFVAVFLLMLYEWSK